MTSFRGFCTKLFIAVVVFFFASHYINLEKVYFLADYNKIIPREENDNLLKKNINLEREDCVIIDTQDPLELKDDLLKNFNLYNPRTKQFFAQKEIEGGKNLTEKSADEKFLDEKSFVEKNIKLNSIRDEMHICLACDNRYAMPTAITIASILQSSNPEDQLHFYILERDVSDANKQKILNLKKQIKNCNIEFIKFDEKNRQILNELPFTEEQKQKWDVMTYARLFIPELIPNVDKIFYLDSDIIVKRSLKFFWEIDLKDNFFAAVHDSSCGNMVKNIEAIDGKKYIYCNAGVMLINCKKWKNENFTQTLIKNVFDLKKQNKLDYLDQDVLNYTVMDKKLILPMRFNMYLHDSVQLVAYLFKDIQDLKKHQDIFCMLTYNCEVLYQQIKEKHVFYNSTYLENEWRHVFCIHYSGSAKPWNTSYKSMFIDDFYDIMRLTDYWDFDAKVNFFCKRVLSFVLLIYVTFKRFSMWLFD